MPEGNLFENSTARSSGCRPHPFSLQFLTSFCGFPAVIGENRKILELLSELLLDEESIDRQQLEEFLSDKKLVFPEKQCTDERREQLDH